MSDPIERPRWRELVTSATLQLEESGVGAASVDVLRMAEEVSGATGAELLLMLDQEVPRIAMASFHQMVTRRADGEPLQYVLGHWGFRNLDLMVDQRVLIPRPETEQVVEAALRELDAMGVARRHATVVDLGTGSGAIGFSVVSERSCCHVFATDVSPVALQVARANLAVLGRPASRVTLCEGSWYEALPEDLRGAVQLIVSNPPYVPDGAELPSEVQRWEPGTALQAGPEGLDAIAQIIAGARDWLEPAGVLVCELSPEQAARVLELAADVFEEAEITSDLAGRQRALVARRPSRS